MEIIKNRDGSKLTVGIVGKIDTNTSVRFREEVADKLGDESELEIDMAKTTYVSSAGMRVLLACQKMMDGRGTMRLVNLDPAIRKLFRATGMLDILNVE